MNDPDRSWPDVPSETQFSQRAWPIPCTNRAIDLALDNHRIDDGANVIHCNMTEELHLFEAITSQ